MSSHGSIICCLRLSKKERVESKGFAEERASKNFPSDVISGLEKKIFVGYSTSLQFFVLFFDLVIEINPNSQISK